MATLTFALLVGFYSHAEYRAYRLSITNQNTGATRQVLTNFDPEQYRDLYPVLQEEIITLDRSWKCRGDTSLSPICPEPPLSVLKSEPN